MEKDSPQKGGMDKRRSRLRAVQGLYMLVQNQNLLLDEIHEDIGCDWIDEQDNVSPIEKDSLKLNSFTHNKELLTFILEGAVQHKEATDAFLAANLEKQESIKRLPLLLCCIVQAALFEIEGLKEQDKKRIIVADYVAVAGAFFDRKETSLLNGLLSRLISPT